MLWPEGFGGCRSGRGSHPPGHSATRPMPKGKFRAGAAPASTRGRANLMTWVSPLGSVAAGRGRVWTGRRRRNKPGGHGAGLRAEGRDTRTPGPPAAGTVRGSDAKRPLGEMRTRRVPGGSRPCSFHPLHVGNRNVDPGAAALHPWASNPPPPPPGSLPGLSRAVGPDPRKEEDSHKPGEPNTQAKVGSGDSSESRSSSSSDAEAAGKDHQPKGKQPPKVKKPKGKKDKKKKKAEREKSP